MGTTAILPVLVLTTTLSYKIPSEMEGAEGVEGTCTVAVMPIYIAIWLEHHGNRLYGFMGLRSKKLGR